VTARREVKQGMVVLKSQANGLDVKSAKYRQLLDKYQQVVFHDKKIRRNIYNKKKNLILIINFLY
jgi:hypothetical protein